MAGTEQAISTGSVDATEVAIDSSVGFVAGAVLGKAKTAIERVGKSILGKIEAKYASPSVKATIEKEVTKEFKTLGKPLGHSGRARAKTEAASRIKNFVEVESSIEGAAEETAKNGTEIIIKIGEYEVEEWLNK